MNKVTEARRRPRPLITVVRRPRPCVRRQHGQILESSHPDAPAELESRRRFVEKANRTVVLGEKGLADRVVTLL
jgi:hypothetical protein